jgi:hypothetical protein
MKYVEVKNGIVISGPWTSDVLPDLSGSGVTPVDITSITPEPKEHWTYDGINWSASMIESSVVSLEQLREIRTHLLEKSDYRDFPSYPHSDQESWREYRQALRDLPDGYVPSEEPVFPEPPN